MSKTMTKAEVLDLFRRAKEAGLAAGNAYEPRPVTFVNHATGERFPCEDGLCGFAEVIVKPGTSRVARLLKSECGWKKHYHGGVYHWIGEHYQSHERKEAHAKAMAEVLKDAGVKATWSSRLD